jgi:hypothetical protein
MMGRTIRHHRESRKILFLRQGPSPHQ